MKKTAALIALMLFLSGTTVHSQNTDIRLLREIHLTPNAGLDKSMRVVSASVLPMMIATPVSILLYNKHSTGSFTEKKEPYIIAGTLLTSSAITIGLKYGVNRSRPYVTYPDIEQRDSHAGPYSFPSGHTSSAFALATSLSLCYQKWYVAVPAYAWAFTVGYSRMRLGVHFPTDVLAGALIGTGCGVATYFISKKLVN
jgi:membrane-associated phospholipid phosphatase